MNEIHKQLFESMHNTQMTSINESIIKDARKVILKLMLYMNTTNKGISPEKDDAVLNALEWLKNNQS